VSVRNHLLRLIALASLAATPALAADQPVLPPLSSLLPLATKAPSVADVEYFMPQPVSAWQAEFAARYWFGEAKTGKTLYGPPSVFSGAVSRLTYRNLLTNSGELYGRMAASNGWFLQGYVGLGAISRGTLQDEDFPSPGFSPYSSTTSEQRNGYLSYVNVNVGYDLLRGGDYNLGVFAGYFLFKEVVNAFGCTQTAGNPEVCQPAIPNAVEAITQNNIWQSPRLGFGGSVVFAERFKLSGDAAWLPYVRLNGTDAHWLRIGGDVGDFAGPIPEDGIGMGYQLEAAFSYDVTPNASVGVGARYWHLQTNGNSHFENLIVGEGGSPQPVSWKSDIYGAFVQASYKFGPFPFSAN
jgi:outer membrane protease